MGSNPQYSQPLPMSSPSPQLGQRRQAGQREGRPSTPPLQYQSQQVVQTILESFSRCFHPVDSATSCGRGGARRTTDGSGFATPAGVGTGGVNGDGRATARRRPSSSSGDRSPHRAADRLSLSGKEWDDLFDDDGAQQGRGHSKRRNRSVVARSRGAAGGEASAVSRAKRAAARAPSSSSSRGQGGDSIPDAAAIVTSQQRSFKRKLGIFRTRSDSSERERTAPKPSPLQRQLVGTQTQGQAQAQTKSSSVTGRNDNALTLSDSDDEILNLTSRKRFACAPTFRADLAGGGGSRSDGPISNFARFFNLRSSNTRAQFSNTLCFATPVRCASLENINGLPDEELTTDEFVIRQAASNTADPHQTLKLEAASIDDGAGDADNDTITSTLYFDQKYSHVVETRPPMPLFPSQAVPEADTDRFTEITWEKQERKSDSEHNQILYQSNPPPKNLFKTHHDSTTPDSPCSRLTDDEELSQMAGGGRTHDHPSSTHLHSRLHRGPCGRTSNHDAPPSPVRISGRSSTDHSRSRTTSASSESADSRRDALRGPEIWYTTAAEV